MRLPQRTSREFLNLVAAKERVGAQWFKIVNKAEEPPTLMIYDEIGYWGLTAQDLIAQVSEINGPLNVHINSPGGEVFEGKAIYTFLAGRGDVTVTVTSLAASIASVIAMAADPGQLRIAKHAEMMIHDAWGACIGNAQDMRTTADLMDQLSNNVAGIYADRTGQPVEYWRNLMLAESWFEDEQAVEAGLADVVWDPKDRSLENKVGHHGPPTGKKAKKKDKKYDAAQNADVDETAWDGEAAMQGALDSDHPAEAFAAICAGEKTVGEPDEEAHWALPHHKAEGNPPNRKGVSSALGYLDRTDDLKDPTAARAHLEAHEKAMGEGDGTNNHVHTDDEFAALAAALQEQDHEFAAMADALGKVNQ